MDKNQYTNLESNTQNEYSTIYNNLNFITTQSEQSNINTFNPSDIFDLAQIEQILSNENIMYI